MTGTSERSEVRRGGGCSSDFAGASASAPEELYRATDGKEEFSGFIFHFVGDFLQN